VALSVTEAAWQGRSGVTPQLAAANQWNTAIGVCDGQGMGFDALARSLGMRCGSQPSSAPNSN